MYCPEVCALPGDSLEWRERHKEGEVVRLWVEGKWAEAGPKREVDSGIKALEYEIKLPQLPYPLFLGWGATVKCPCVEGYGGR